MACFQHTVRHLDTMLGDVSELGRAWAEGNLQRLAELSNAPPLANVCWTHLTNVSIAQQQGIDLQQEMDAVWLQGLRSVTTQYQTIFIHAPVRDVLHWHGRIRLLLNEGFLPRHSPPIVDAP